MKKLTTILGALGIMALSGCDESNNQKQEEPQEKTE